MGDGATVIRNIMENENLKSSINSNQECAVYVNNCFRLSSSTSGCSVSSESDHSISLSLDREVEAVVSLIGADELPAFQIRLLSPLGRSPSPIDNEAATIPIADNRTPTKFINEYFSPSCHQNNPNYVNLQDINNLINPPSDLSRTNSLETIFEGVFLTTPPRHRFAQHHCKRSRANISEKVALTRLQTGKENHSPLRCKPTFQRIPKSIDQE